MSTHLPDNPLKFIQHCVKERNIFWTYHVNMRMQGRFIDREAILESFASHEIIEEYPEDKYFPSYLVLARYQGNPFHILFAADIEEFNVRIITAYRPNPSEWDDLFKSRRH